MRKGSTIAEIRNAVDGFFCDSDAYSALWTIISPLSIPGVMRADVIKALGASERSLKPADLAEASEAFLTNSLGIRPLVSVDGVPVGGGQPGAVCEMGLRAVGLEDEPLRDDIPLEKGGVVTFLVDASKDGAMIFI